MLLRDCQRECGAALESLGEVRKPLEVHGIQFERIHTVNPLSTEPRSELLGVFVCVHCNASRGLARTMQARRFGRSDVNPRLQCPSQIAYGDRRLIRLGYSIRKSDALRVLEAVGEQPRQHALGGFGRMTGYAQAQRLVDSGVGVRQLDVKYVNRVTECHS